MTTRRRSRTTATSAPEKPKGGRKRAPIKKAAKRKRRPTPAHAVAAYLRRVRRGTVDDRATRYADDVAQGRVVAGPWVRLACKRHLEDLERTDIAWDLEAAQLKIAFFEDVLNLNGGQFEGLPFLLQPWQAFNIGALFGWKRLDGTRRFRRGLIETGKGNGKSPMIAGIGMIGLCADREPRAEVYFGAPKKDQAFIPFRDAVAMVDLNEEDLGSRITKSGVEPVWNLAHRPSGSFARPLSGEGRTSKGQGGTKSGFRPHFNLLDELHEHPNSIVVDMMLAGVKSRRQPLTLGITNSGFDRNSVCWQWHDYSIRVLQRLVKDDTWFSYICALDEGDDPLHDKGCWIKANPNLGVSVLESQLQEQVDLALGMPSKKNFVLRINFCVWTQQEEAGIDLDDWDQCAGEVDPESLRGRSCFPALDLGAIADLTALVLVFPGLKPRERMKILPFFWMPREGVAEKVVTDKVPYDDWIDRGLIATTPGNATDFDFVRAKINELAEVYRFKRIAHDPRDAGQLATQLGGDGFEMVKVAQTHEGLAAGTHQTLRMIGDHLLEHDGNEVLRWMVSNVALIENANGDLRPDKRKSFGRIDGFHALVMAVEQADRHLPAGPSIWEQHSAEEWSGGLADVPPVDDDDPDDDPSPDGGGARVRRKSIYESEEWTEFAKEHGYV